MITRYYSENKVCFDHYYESHDPEAYYEEIINDVHGDIFVKIDDLPDRLFNKVFDYFQKRGCYPKYAAKVLTAYFS